MFKIAFSFFFFGFCFFWGAEISFKRAPLLGDTTEEVVFCFSLMEADSVVYEVYFGDGGKYQSSQFVSGEVEVFHRYSGPGRYWVRVFARSKRGYCLADSQVIEIRDNLFFKEISLPSATVSSPACDGNDNFYLGLEDNALVSFKKDGSFRFSFPTRNSVYATPVVFENRVIFGCLDSTLYCLDTSGVLLWSYDGGGEFYQAVATNGEFIVATTDDGRVLVLTMKGRLLWQRRVGSEPSSPTIDGKGNVFLTADGVYGFNRKGKLLFSFKTPDTDLFTMGCVLSPEGLLLSGCEDGNLYCLTKKGELVWKAPTPEEDPIRCEGVFYDDTFLFGCDDGSLYKKGRYGGLVRFWQTDGEIISSPVITKEGWVFFFSDDGNLYCVRQDGQLIFRKEIAYSEKGFFITPSLLLTSDGVLIATSWDERVYLFRAGETSNHRLWHTYRGNRFRTGFQP